MNELEKLKQLETMPKELKARAFLEIIKKGMENLGLSWIDLATQLEGSECPICSSRIRECLNCHKVVSVGSRKCIHCGESLEKVEIEPTRR